MINIKRVNLLKILLRDDFTINQYILEDFIKLQKNIDIKLLTLKKQNYKNSLININNILSNLKPKHKNFIINKNKELIFIPKSFTKNSLIIEENNNLRKTLNSLYKKIK